jgi:hypothetical protein
MKVFHLKTQFTWFFMDSKKARVADDATPRGLFWSIKKHVELMQHQMVCFGQQKAHDDATLIK